MQTKSSSTSIDFHNFCIATLSGQVVSLIDPQPATIVVEDIARGLANKGHFGGHTPSYFSIAEHSLLVMDLLKMKYVGRPRLALVALLHDASEAYLGDMVRPLKDVQPDFRPLEDKMSKAIFAKFKLDYEDMKIIKPFDILAQEIEYDCFYRKVSAGLNFYSPDQSYENFLRACKQLMDEIGGLG